MKKLEKLEEALREESSCDKKYMVSFSIL
jgi:hypothetical protein